MGCKLLILNSVILKDQPNLPARFSHNFGNYLRQADQSQAVELGVATGASEGGRKGAELGLGHRGAVAVVDVQHGHLVLAGLNEN